MMVPYRLGMTGIGWKFTEKLVSQTYRTIRIGDLFVLSSSGNRASAPVKAFVLGFGPPD